MACQGGTYVRKLIHDLGQELGCGAHMLSLKRTRSGPFALDECVSLTEIEEAGRLMAEGQCEPVRRLVRPVEQIVGRMLPRVWLDDGALHSVCTGYPLAVPGICELNDFERDDRVAALTMKGELVGIGRAVLSSEEVLRADHGLAVKVDRVLMQPDVYPKPPGRRP